MQWLCRRRPGGTVTTCPGHLLLLNELMRPPYHSCYHQAADIWGVPGGCLGLLELWSWLLGVLSLEGWGGSLGATVVMVQQPWSWWVCVPPGAGALPSVSPGAGGRAGDIGDVVLGFLRGSPLGTTGY